MRDLEEKILTQEREEKETRVEPSLEEVSLEEVLRNIFKSKEIPGQFGDFVRLTRLGVFRKFAQVLSEHHVDDGIYCFGGTEINVKITSWVHEWNDEEWSEEAAIICIGKGLFAREYKRFKPKSIRVADCNVEASRYVTMCEDVRDSLRAIEHARLGEKRTADRQAKRAAEEKKKLLVMLNNFRSGMRKAAKLGNWAGVKWQARRIKNLERKFKLTEYTEEANSYIKLALTELNEKTKQTHHLILEKKPRESRGLFINNFKKWKSSFDFFYDFLKDFWMILS